MMKTVTIIDLMESMRADGWLVVLKCAPVVLPWLIEGSRSEYDAPCEDCKIGKGKWHCEASDFSLKEPYRLSEWALDDDPLEAVKKVWFQIQKSKDELTPAR